METIRAHTRSPLPFLSGAPRRAGGGGCLPRRVRFPLGRCALRLSLHARLRLRSWVKGPIKAAPLPGAVGGVRDEKRRGQVPDAGSSRRSTCSRRVCAKGQGGVGAGTGRSPGRAVSSRRSARNAGAGAGAARTSPPRGRRANRTPRTRTPSPDAGTARQVSARGSDPGEAHPGGGERVKARSRSGSEPD